MAVFSAGEEWLLNLLDTVDEGIHAVDIDGATLVYNRAAGRMDGLKQKDVIGKHVLSVFPSLRSDTSTLLQVLKTGTGIVNRTQTYTNYLGVKVHTVNTTLPILSGGKVIGALEIAKDLTQVKMLSEQVLSLQAQVVGSKRTKSSGGKRADGSTTEGAQNGAQALYQFSQILTRDEQLQDVKARAELAARTASPVLVYGETGTGKELMVQAIHNASPRQQQPFLALNCAALPAPLLEGILFGTVRGSFTGAGDREGLFELADGGTLFLDEIQSMPLELQAKLLRVLQEGDVLRVGDTRVRRVSVRVIVAMNQSPETAMREGTLRQDLYYRINVVRLDLPPLRARRGDIPLLLQHFLEKWNGRFGLQVEGFDDEVLALFQDYPWPGNVREMENAVEAAMNLVSTGVITRSVLPVQIREYGENGASDADAGTGASRRWNRSRGADVERGVSPGREQRNRGLDSSAGFSAGGSVDAADRGMSRGTGQEIEGAETDAGEIETQKVEAEGTKAATAERDKQSLSRHSLSFDQRLPEWVELLQSFGMDSFWSTLQRDGQSELKPDFPEMAGAFERIVLIKALNSVGGNVKQAAARLGIPRQTLQYRLKQAGISPRGQTRGQG